MTCQVNFHLYHYAGNNPVKYVDPDGRMQRDENGDLLFIPDIDEQGNIQQEQKGYLGKDSINVIPGFLLTDDGEKVRAYKNNSGDERFDTNCHGTTFADGEYWVESDQVQTILEHDDYNKVSLSEVNRKDVIIYYDYKNKINHSGTIVENKGNNDINVKNLAGDDMAPKIINYQQAALKNSARWDFWRKE